MINNIEVYTELDQSFKVQPNWEGDKERSVLIEISEPTNEKTYQVYVTVKELRELVKAAEIIISEVQGE